MDILLDQFGTPKSGYSENRRSQGPDAIGNMLANAFYRLFTAARARERGEGDEALAGKESQRR